MTKSTGSGAGSTGPVEIMSEALAALAERVEALVGPDREVDTDIFEAFDDLADWCKGPSGWPAYKPIRDSDPPSLQSQRAYLAAHAPAYTASIDAAVSLLPEGAIWRKYTDPSASVYGASPYNAAAQVRYDGTGATPALQIVSAYLRMMIAKEEKREAALRTRARKQEQSA